MSDILTKHLDKVSQVSPNSYEGKNAIFIEDDISFNQLQVMGVPRIVRSTQFPYKNFKTLYQMSFSDDGYRGVFSGLIYSRDKTILEELLTKDEILEGSISIQEKRKMIEGLRIRDNKLEITADKFTFIDMIPQVMNIITKVESNYILLSIDKINLDEETFYQAKLQEINLH